MRGDELAHNAGVICVKGSMLRALPYVQGRLTTPMIRRAGKGSPLTPATWEEAMTLVASKFQEAIAASGPDSVAFYGSGQLFTEESYTANKLFKAGIRTNNVDGNPRLCMASAATGYTQTFGKDEPPGSYEDIDHADCLFVIGANPFHCHPPLHERMMRRKRLHPETTIICVDPRRTDTADHADIHLAPVPGADLLLLNSMAQVICADGLVDVEFVKRHVRFTDGDKTIELDAFKAFLDASYTPEQVSQELGITAIDIRRVAHRFATAKATMSLWTMGLNQRTQGTALNAMVSSTAPAHGPIRSSRSDAVFGHRSAQCLRRSARHRRALPRAAQWSGRCQPQASRRDGADLGCTGRHHQPQAGTASGRSVSGDGRRQGAGCAGHVHQSSPKLAQLFGADATI